MNTNQVATGPADTQRQGCPDGGPYAAGWSVGVSGALPTDLPHPEGTPEYNVYRSGYLDGLRFFLASAPRPRCRCHCRRPSWP